MVYWILWPTKENMQKIMHLFVSFVLFFVFELKIPKWGQMGPGGFFLTNPDLADILGRTDFDFEIFYLWNFVDPQFPDFQVPDFQISRNLVWSGAQPEFQNRERRICNTPWYGTPRLVNTFTISCLSAAALNKRCLCQGW